MKSFSRISALIFASVVAVCISDAAATNIVRVRSSPRRDFDPTNIVIRPGDRIVWTNVSSELHDTTGPGGLWMANLNSSASFGFTFSNLGYYPYQCNRHVLSQQTGTVSVVNISLASALRTPTNAQFTINGGRQGLKAVVEAGASLSGLSPIATNVFPASGSIRFTNNSPPPTNRFYRARAIP